MLNQRPEMDKKNTPISLPDDFDPAVNLPAREVNGKVFHATISGMNIATQLIENGTPLYIERAEKGRVRIEANDMRRTPQIQGGQVVS